MKIRHHQRICLQVFWILQDLVKLGSCMTSKELDSYLRVFDTFTAHWARLRFNVEEKVGFTSFEVGVYLFLISAAVFVFTSEL